MHILICGLGSIGRRHLRHFRELGVERIDAYRSGLAKLSDAGQLEPDHVYNDYTDALATHPDAVIIATPTALHLEQARQAVVAGCHVLIEKPVSHSLDGLAEFAATVKRAGRIVCVAQNLRFHPILRMLREWVCSAEPLGEAQLLRAHHGAYLPDWHSWEDYRTSYAARADLGGGCRRTHIHEIDYAIWIMGPASDVHGMDSTMHPLQTNVDEMTAVIVRHESGALSSITLSLAERVPSRTIHVAFSRGTFSADLVAGTWVARGPGDWNQTGRVPDGFTIDQTYRDQAVAFISAIRGEGSVPVTVEDAEIVLRAALTPE
jgi:predicted dehydrogenase